MITLTIALSLAFVGSTLLAVSKTMQVYGHIFEHRPLALRLHDRGILLLMISLPIAILAAFVRIIGG